MAIIPAEEKVFMVSNSTNTTYSGSAALKAMQQWYTMEDVTNTVRPYKVFTALLTQNGTSFLVNATSGLLIVGVSYNIDTYEAGDDFSNVGGPGLGQQGEWDGYWFIATGITPTNWNNSSSLDYNDGAPVATVLENTIGNIWFEYISVGTYAGFVPIVAEQKQVVFSPTNAFKTSTGESYVRVLNNSIDGEIYINATDGTSGVDGGVISDFPIEIRVYN